jgi:AraC-like DNA-binding protein
MKMAERLAPPKLPLDELQQLIIRHRKGLRTETKIPGLTLHYVDTAMPLPVQVFYRPMVCLIAQGRKSVMVGDATLDYDPSNYLIASADMPAKGRITAATPSSPYLAFTLALDPKVVSAILMELPKDNRLEQSSARFAISQSTPEFLDAFVRLLRLLDHPSDIASLSPLIIREIHFRLLTGEHARLVRQVALRKGYAESVSKAIDWIRQNYAKPLHIDELAGIANMSSASLYRHFKVMTTMSPIQYQKQLRLQEARRILVSEMQDAAAAGFTVGYESPSQFSREYRRLFGAPPRQDVARVRGSEKQVATR